MYVIKIIVVLFFVLSSLLHKSWHFTIFHSVSASELISFLVFDDCVWIRSSGAFSYIFLLFPLAHCHFLSGPLGQMLTEDAHEWWMMTGGLSGANRMHNTASIQQFQSSSPETWCSFYITLLEDLPPAGHQDHLKWKSTAKQLSGMYFYLESLRRVFWWVLEWSAK